MTYKEFLLSDKKGMAYLIGLTLIISYLAISTSIANNINIYLTGSLIIILLTASFIQDYLIFLKQDRIRKLADNRTLKISNAKMAIMNEPLLPFRQRKDSLSKTVVKEQAIEFYEDNDVIIILSHFEDFGILKRHMKPIIISKSNEIITRFGKPFDPNKVSYSLSNNIMTILFHFGFCGIKSFEFEYVEGNDNLC